MSQPIWKILDFFSDVSGEFLLFSSSNDEKWQCIIKIHEKPLSKVVECPKCPKHPLKITNLVNWLSLSLPDFNIGFHVGVC